MQQPACWPHWLDDVWAKSPEKGLHQAPESLAQHTWFVLSRFVDLVRLRPHLPHSLGMPRLWQILILVHYAA